MSLTNKIKKILLFGLTLYVIDINLPKNTIRHKINYMPDYQKNTTLVSANKWETQERWKAKKSGIVQDYRSYINGNIGDYRYWVGFAFCDEEIIKPAYIIKDLKTGLIYINKDGDNLAEKVLKNYKGHLEEFAPKCD